MPRSNEAVYKPGMLFEGGTARPLEAEAWGAIRALDANTGAEKWQYKFSPFSRAGVLSTAGNIVVGARGDGGFVILDASTGKELWRLNLGGQAISGPMTFLSKGQQRIAIAAGNSLFVFGL